MAKTASNGTISKRGVLNEGRPKAVIDYVRLRKLAKIQCTQDEIASVLDISVDTLSRDARAMEIWRSAMALGRMSVRRAQYRAMLKGDNTMLIWLGKQYLGQREPPREITGADGSPVQINVTNEADPIANARAIAFALELARRTIQKASATDPESA